MNSYRWVRCGVTALALAAGCETGAIPAVDGGIDAGVALSRPRCTEDGGADGGCCPPGWVAYAHGGCGPAVLLCAADGGAAPGACEGVDLRRGTAVRDEDGAESIGFFRQSDGRIGGAWSDPWPCPPGWQQEPDGACAPVLRDDCATNAAALPDGRCTATGVTACAATWPELPAEAQGQRVIHVRERASRTPDGSRDAPYPTLSEALSANPEARWFVLASGTYVGNFTTRDALHIVGACAGGVRLATAPDTITTLFRVEGPRARLDLRQLTLSATESVVVASDGAEVSLETVSVFDGVADAFVLGAGTRFAARGSFFRARGNNMPERPRHTMLAAPGNAAVTLRDSAFRGPIEQMIYLTGGGSLRAENVSIESPSGISLWISARSRLELLRSSIRRSYGAAVRVDGAAVAQIEDLDLRDLEPPNVVGYDWAALRFIGGSTGTARRVVLRNVSGRGIVVEERATSLEADQVSVRRVRADNGDHGLGIEAIQGRLALRRAIIEDTTQVGLMCQQLARCDVRDVAVRGVRPQADGVLGVGIADLFGGNLRLRRALIEGAALAGISAGSIPERIARSFSLERFFGADADPVARIDLGDVIVRENTPRDGAAAFGVVTAAGSAIEARRLAVDQSRGVGIAATDTGYPTRPLLAGFVRTGMIRESDARGLAAILGPTLDGPSTVSAQDVFVRGVSPWWYGLSPDAPDQSPPLRAGLGAYVAVNCRLNLSNFVLDGAGLGDHGALSFGSLNLSRGTITRQRRCALTASNDAAPRIIRDRVDGRDNGRDDDVCIDDALPDLRVVVGSE